MVATALKVLAQQQQEASTQSLQQAMAGGFSPPKDGKIWVWVNTYRYHF